MLENLGYSELFWGTGVSPPGFPRQPEATQGLLAGPGSSLQLSLCAGSWAPRSWVLTSVLNVGPTGDMRKTFDFYAITHSFVAAVLSALPY